MKNARRLSVKPVISALVFLAGVSSARATDLAAIEVYFRDQPRNEGNRVDSPQVGQRLYPHVAYYVDAAAALTGGLRLEVDGKGLCSGDVTLRPGSRVNWCTDPWTVTAGTHTLRAVLDRDRTIAESDEGNNIATFIFEAERPDLAVTEVYFRDQPGSAGNRVDDPQVGQQLYPHVAFYVDSAVPLTGGLRLEVDGKGLCSGHVTLRPGNRVNWCTDPWTVTAGTHTLRAVLDRDRTIAESDEGNNVATFVFTVPWPDLAVTEVYFRDQPGNAGSRVDNPEVGQQLYPHVAFYVDAAGPLTGKIWKLELDGNFLCSRTATEPTGSRVGWCGAWTVTAGNHTLRGVLDPDGTFAESNGGNNIATLDFTVPRPDLEATDVYFRDQPGNAGNRVDNPQVGQQLYPHIAYNLNDASALTGKIWKLELDGNFLCSFVGTARTGSQVGWCGTPWTVTAGNHTLRGVLDPDATIPESNGGNNVATLSFTGVIPEVKAVMTSPAPGSTLASQSAAFAWSRGSGVAEYWLTVGTQAGGYDLYGQSQGLDRSVTVSRLPENGCTVYARLSSRFGSEWQHNDYTYTANTYAGSLDCGPSCVDLTIHSANINRSSGVWGDTFTITLRIINLGNFLVASTARARIYFYIREVSEPFSGVCSASKIGEITASFGGLPNFPSPEVDFNYVLPSLAAGDYFLTYWIDAPGFIRERNEDNNAGRFRISVVRPPEAPTISSVSPNPVTGSAGQQTITVRGANFVNKPTLTLTWPGQSGYTVPSGQVTLVTSRELRMSITATTPGTWTVKVTNPDEQSSAPFPFTVEKPPAPSISRVSPSPVTAFNTRQTITIYGAHFVNKPTLTLTWTGQPNYTVPDARVTFVNSSELRMSVTTTATPDSWTVKVTNPDEQSSNPWTFQVAPLTVIAPVVGAFRATGAENPDCTNVPDLWTFCQHQTDLHRPGGGLSGSDDTYAWDMNQLDDADNRKPVYAVASGKVVRYAGTVAPGAVSGAVLIEHTQEGRTWWSGYLHMNEISVSESQQVTAFTPIGKISNVCACGSIPNHLHFVVYEGANEPGELISRNVDFRQSPGPLFTGLAGGRVQPPQNGQFQLEILARTEKQVAVQGSDNLTTWVDIETVAITGGKGAFSDSTANSRPRRFYRAKP
ncbi:MAG: peptidoglycan DD-metalloendopeptidase family protein [Verrucomicrobia bacterium]|nr:peptidoglycan DD-metalloendopeptidase family protein [Verrucomicrobiota bacterium]